MRGEVWWQALASRLARAILYIACINVKAKLWTESEPSTPKTTASALL